MPLGDKFDECSDCRFRGKKECLKCEVGEYFEPKEEDGLHFDANNIQDLQETEDE
jgi:hypothetical protein